MMNPGELSIKIRIADRDYPMKVSATDEERIRQAGKIINQRLKGYRDQFGIDDKQDLLAMVAFDCLIDKMHAEENHNLADQNEIHLKIHQLNELVSKAL
jgi:cell division protein ZapA